MTKDTITKLKWFWTWQDEKEETWLRQQSQQGWHLSALALPCFYTFTAGEKQDIVYRLDYQIFKKKEDKQAYLQLFRDTGWEYVGEMSNWQYFRKPAQEGEAQEIFSDVESKIQKYQHLIGLMVIFLPILVVLRPDIQNSTGVGIFYLGLMILYIYSMLRLIFRIGRLKKRL